MAIKHKFVSGKANDADATLVRPTNWNDEHEAAHPPGYIQGLVPVNGTDADHDINIGTGFTVDTTSAKVLDLTSVLTKQIDAVFAVGNNAGGLFSGVVAADTWYHLFVIRRTSDGVIDAYFDTSVTAANIPTGFVEFRRIASVLTDVAANIIGYTALEIWGGGLQVLWDSIVSDVDEANDGTAATKTLSIPPGYKVESMLMVRVENTVNDRIVYISSLDVDDEIPDDAPTVRGHVRTDKDTSGHLEDIAGPLFAWSDTSSQVRVRSSGGGGNRQITTQGWKDPRRD